MLSRWSHYVPSSVYWESTYCFSHVLNFFFYLLFVSSNCWPLLGSRWNFHTMLLLSQWRCELTPTHSGLTMSLTVRSQWTRCYHCMLNSSCEHPMRSGWPNLFVSHHELTTIKLQWSHGQLIRWAHKCEIFVTSLWEQSTSPVIAWTTNNHLNPQ